MLNNRGFDLWADGYDREVGLTDDDGRYPFAGYRDVLGGIYSVIARHPGASVLDLGFGTGTLTAKLCELGCDVYGQDFSDRMLEIAQEKMPSAHLYKGDLTREIAGPLADRRYGFIVATYSLHHLNDGRKKELITELLGLLEEGGSMLIGDVAFGTAEDMDHCRLSAGDEWDDEEIYIVADKLRDSFPDMAFEKKSYCAGIITIQKKTGEGK